MAARKKKPAKPPILKRISRVLGKITGILGAILVAYMLFEGGVVHLRTAELPIKTLPQAFVGTRVLYLSDLHINSLNSVDKINAMMDELMYLNPDLLLLGGDYTNLDPIMRITAGITGAQSAYAVETEMRDLFFLHLKDYNPPLGKFGVAGECDNLLERNAGSSLLDAMQLGGVTLLRDRAVKVTKDNESIVLVGVDDWSTGAQNVRLPAEQVSSKDCVILICHNPEAIPQLNNEPANDGIWIDAALAGHTHGGGVRPFGYGLFSQLSNIPRFAPGWHLENSAKVLISNGIGNDLLPMRLGAEPQAHLLTLVRYAAE